MSISEKTLELNVSHNLLSISRIFSPSAFLIGFTLRNERVHGLDVAINLNDGRLGPSYQFKKPTMRQNVYKFSINNNNAHDQHHKLVAWATILRIVQGYSPVFYAFPAIANYNQLSILSPNFLNDTYFVSPLDFPDSILDNHSHVLEIDVNTDSITVSSKSKSKISKFTKGFQSLDWISKSYNKSLDVKLLKTKIMELNEKKVSSFIKEEYKNKISDSFIKLQKKNWKIGLKGLIFPVQD